MHFRRFVRCSGVKYGPGGGFLHLLAVLYGRRIAGHCRRWNLGGQRRDDVSKRTVIVERNIICYKPKGMMLRQITTTLATMPFEPLAVAQST